ncbi:translation initiation factor eIF4A [Tulasnella sp. JGI-2019a]|nr:translation initiation factor eIF4A [Tulasnella sp. JGI-2019a]
MISRRALKTDHLKIICLDEADDMLFRGFREQIDEVFQVLPEETQVILASPTMPNDVLDVIDKLVHDPVRILVKRDELTLEGMKQFYINAEKEEWKLDTLTDLYETTTITQVIVFCNTLEKVNWLTEKLHHREFPATAMHGNVERKVRDALMKELRSSSPCVVITTDLFAYAIGVQRVPLIINYDLPTEKADYLRRVGRGGMFGRKSGVAYNFVTNEEMGILREIEKFYNTCIDTVPLNVP